MDMLEDGYSEGSSFELLDEARLVPAVSVEALEGVHVGRVEVSMKLEVGPVFMPEHAGRAILAEVCLVERAAVVLLELVSVAENGSRGELLL